MKLKEGTAHTSSERGGKVLEIDASYLKDVKGNNFGHLEIIQHVTAREREVQYRKIWFHQLGTNLKNLSEGSMEMELGLARPDQYTQRLYEMYSEINNDLGQVASSIKALITDADKLSKAAIHGSLDTRVDASRHKGDYRKIVEGINKTMESVVGTFEAMPTPIMFLDKDLNIQYVNAAGAKYM